MGVEGGVGVGSRSELVQVSYSSGQLHFAVLLYCTRLHCTALHGTALHRIRGEGHVVLANLQI